MCLRCVNGMQQVQCGQGLTVRLLAAVPDILRGEHSEWPQRLCQHAHTPQSLETHTREPGRRSSAPPGGALYCAVTVAITVGCSTSLCTPSAYECAQDEDKQILLPVTRWRHISHTCNCFPPDSGVLLYRTRCCVYSYIRLQMIHQYI